MLSLKETGTPDNPKKPTDSMQAQSKLQWHFSQNYNSLQKNRSKICTEPQKILNSQKIFRKKTRTNGITLPNFKQSYGTQSSMAVVKYKTNTPMEQN